MRKILTMMAAVASAIGLYAADSGALSGTSFEELNDGDGLNITDPTGELTGTGGFWRTNGTDTLTIKAGTSVVEGSENRSKAFEPEYENTRYMSIKTESPTNSISRYVNVGGGATNINDGAATGLYFDSFVKFTAFDSDPDINLGSNGKLAIWLKEEGEAKEGTLKTNLVITAGYLDSNLQAGAVVTNYNCAVVRGVNFNDGGWHRVTVKAIDSIYNNVGGTTPGFVVFIDRNYVYCTDDTTMGISGSLKGTASKWNGVKALFPSACQDGADKDSISAVDFAGQGDVDELVFTRTAPFDDAEDVGLFTIQVGEGVAKVTFTTNGVSEEITSNKSLTLDNAWTTGGITITATYDDGYVADTWDGLSPESGNLFKPDTDGQYVQVRAKLAGATVNGVGYETLADAIAYVNDATKCPAGTYTITMAENASGNVDITNAGITNILDLAGNTFTGTSTAEAAIKVTAGALIIKDTVGGGTVQGAVDNDGALVGAVDCGTETIAIEGGIYRGNVLASAKSISGGYFLMTHQFEDAGEPVVQDVNEKETLDPMIIDGYEVTNSGSTLYWEVTEKAPTPTYTVTFISGEGSVTNEYTDVVEGTEQPVPVPAAVVGKSFSAWDPAIAGATVTVEADATYTALYTNNIYTITFVIGENSSSEQMAYGSEITSVPEIPIRPGYTGAWDDDPAGDTVTGDKTYTYTYSAETYTITYMYGENALSGLTPNTYTVEDAVTLPSEVDLGVVGVSFEAWTNAQGEVVANWAAGAIGNKTFYAQVTVPGPAEKYEPGDSGITPPTGKTAAEFATAINANKAAYIDTPSTTDVADTTAYLALFEAVADTEKGTVSIGLTTEAAADAKDAADDTAADIVSDLTATTVTIDAEPGLWYSISVSSTLGGLATGEGTRVMATDSSLSEGKLTLDIPVIDDSTPARFYKVNVNLADKPVTP